MRRMDFFSRWVHLNLQVDEVTDMFCSARASSLSLVSVRRVEVARTGQTSRPVSQQTQRLRRWQRPPSTLMMHLQQATPPRAEAPLPLVQLHLQRRQGLAMPRAGCRCRAASWVLHFASPAWYSDYERRFLHSIKQLVQCIKNIKSYLKGAKSKRVRSLLAPTSLS